MDVTEFKQRASEVAEWVGEYHDSLTNTSRQVQPIRLEPGYIDRLLGTSPSLYGETWETVMRQIQEKILPGLVHWQHPRFHSYSPTAISYPTMLGEIVTSALAVDPFSWAASPACTELQTAVTDMLGRAFHFPSRFLRAESSGKGGGVIVGSNSEAVLVAMLAARQSAFSYLVKPGQSGGNLEVLGKLVAYCSSETHASVAKAARVAMVKLRVLDANGKGRLHTDTLRQAIRDDEARGLHPFFVVGNSGTTASCSFDKLAMLGQVVENLPACWFHVDASYAGNAWILPESRHMMHGLDKADSIAVDPGKWLLSGADTACLWVADSDKLRNALIPEPHIPADAKDKTADYRNWTITSSRRCNALSLWAHLNATGMTGLQQHVRTHIRLAQFLEGLVRSDHRFVVTNQVRAGVVCFKLLPPQDSNVTSDRINELLLVSVNSSGNLHLAPVYVNQYYCVRFCVGQQHSSEDIIRSSWEMIQDHATRLLAGVHQGLPEPSDRQTKLEERFGFTKKLPLGQYLELTRTPMLRDEATPIWLSQESLMSPPEHPAEKLRIKDDYVLDFGRKLSFGHFF